MVVPFPQNHFWRLVVEIKRFACLDRTNIRETITMYSGVPSVVKVRAGTFVFSSESISYLKFQSLDTHHLLAHGEVDEFNLSFGSGDDII